MSRLAELLNPATPSTAGSPAPDPPDPQEPPESQEPQLPEQDLPSSSRGVSASQVAEPATSTGPPTAFDAARVRTSLANSSASLPSLATASISPAAFPTYPYTPATPAGGSVRLQHPGPLSPGPGETFGPVEVASPLGYQTEHSLSPTLDQYHHSSRPSLDWRRASAPFPTVPAPVLAPLQPRRASETARNTDQSDQSQVGPSLQTKGNKMDTETQDNMDIDVRDSQPTTQQAESPANVVSSPPKIKTEPMGTPREGTPQSLDRKASLPKLDIDDATMRTVTDLKKDELGLRSTSRESATPSSAMEPPKQLPVPTPTQKRPAPKTSTKKGTAAKKPPTKKRKAETTGTRDSTPTAKAIARQVKSKSGTPRLSNSPAPSARTSNAADSEAEGDDSGSDAGVFCICRKGDNHTWMIGCDGGCEDWFHGKCVGVSQANGDLIDKYICPNCQAAGRGVTTYLPQCRRPGCQKPARVTSAIDANGKKKSKSEGSSKYCSDECGQLFMTAMIERSHRAARSARGELATSPRSKRKKNPDPTFEPEELSDDDLGPRGGPLKRSELAGLLKDAPSVDVFRSLGSTLAPPTPPPTSHSNPPPVSDEAKDTDGDPSHNPLASAHLTPDERTHLADLATKKATLRARRDALADWERFLNHIFDTTRRANTTADGKKSSQATCGYDPRVAWNEAEFARFATSRAGRRLLHPDDTADRMDVDGDDDDDEAATAPPKTCTAKRCSRHDAWQRNATGVLKAERVHLTREAGAVEREEQEVWERAGLRARKQADVGGASGGWVEEVG